MDPNYLSAIIFYSLIFILIYIYRKKFEIHGIAALYKTKIGLKLMDKIANSFPRFLRFLSTIGIYICFAGMIFITFFLIKGAYDLFAIPDSTATLSLLIPGVKIPGFVFVPFWYGIISIFVVVVIHEFSHGVVARLHKVNVQSSGVGMFAIFPLAFVEPEEKQLTKKDKKQQLAVFAAGPLSNILTAVVILLLTLFLIVPLENNLFEFKGITIDSVVQNSPAQNAGLQAGDILTAVNGIKINETNLNSLLSAKKPGEEVMLSTTNKEIAITPIEQKDDGMKPYYGIFMRPKIDVKESVSSKFGNKFPWSIFYIAEFFSWLFTLSLGIGLANLLPLGPVDGGRMMLIALTRFFDKEKAKAIWTNITWIIIVLLLINLAFPFIKKLIHPSL
jgi:membrane-associated protease RseP (regulator of RpoE activity)